MAKIRCAVVGVGNCFAGLVQGIEYYRQHPNQEVTGVMHPGMGGYGIHDIEFVAAFDVDSKKVGKPLNEAVYAEPNKVRWVESLPTMNDVIVKQSPQLDGVGMYVQKVVTPVAPRAPEELKEEIQNELKQKKVEILVSYLPVGADKATQFWAQMCLDANIGFVNCMPSFIASEPEWAKRFEKAGLPVVGDDIKGQIGATIVHRTLAKLCDKRATKIEKTYQINVGGNSVSGDQEIILIHNGKTIRTTIGDFIDGWIVMFGEKRMDGKEVVDIARTGQKLQCFTLDDDFKAIPVEVSELIRHHLHQELYHIDTYEGRRIKITKDHNLFMLDADGELKTITAGSIKERNTMIAVPKALPLVDREDLKHINLTPHLKELFAQGIDADGNLMIHNHPEIRIPLNFPVNENLLHTVGLWLADGSFDRIGSSNLEIACGNDAECLQVIDRFAADFNIGYTVRGQKQVAVRIMSKTLSKIFSLALGLEGNSYTKRVPSWVFDLSDLQMAAVVRGYVSGDGTVTGKQIRWTTASPGLAEDLRTLLLRLGINSSVFREDYKEKFRKERRSYRSSLESINHGIISSKEDVEVFIEKIGFIQSEKNRRAQDAAGKLTKGATHVVPKFSLLEKWGIRSTSWKRIPTLKAHTVLKQLDKIKDEKDKERIMKVYFGDTRFLKIKSIKRLEPEPQYVYDLSVPGYERFICSNILVHNTDFLSMKEQERLTSKKISKTESVQSQLKQRLPDDRIYVGPSDFIPFLGNTKLMFMRIEGRMWANIPYNMEVRLEVDDKANSAGIVVDAIRYCKIALDRKQGGPLIGPSAWLMKHPPKQFSDDEAQRLAEEFVK